MGKRRILVMDDEEIVRKVARKMLSRMGYEIEEARDGHEAIALYEQAIAASAGFDAIIIDLKIQSGMGGQEAMAALKKIDPGVKAIISSGFSIDPVLDDYQLHGYCGAVRKPYRYAELSKAILCALEEAEGSNSAGH